MKNIARCSKKTQILMWFCSDDTVYECPGMAASSGEEMVVTNPMFRGCGGNPELFGIKAGASAGGTIADSPLPPPLAPAVIPAPSKRLTGTDLFQKEMAAFNY